MKLKYAKVLSYSPRLLCKIFAQQLFRIVLLEPCTFTEIKSKYCNIEQGSSLYRDGDYLRRSVWF